MARWIVFAGITALLVTGYFATFYAHGRSYWRSVQTIPAELQTKSELVLKRLNADWASVKVDGQIAYLSGVAPTEADRDDLRQAVREAAGAGGAWWGGITQVRDDLTVEPPKSPYIWSAKRGADGRVQLNDYVPGQRFHRAIKAEAQKLFPTGVDDQMKIASGHPTGDWQQAVILALRQLNQLESGEARFENQVLTIRGEARDATVQAAIYAAVKKLPAPYQGVPEITLTNAIALPDAPSTDEMTPLSEVPEAAPVQRLAAADCQKLVDQAMAANTIAFASTSMTIKVSSYKVLDRMAHTATDCGTLRFRITGHTDGSSLEGAVDNLSRDRAEAVADYLATKGVARERLITIGAGSSQPIGDVDTPEGQARNRRIEITVLP
ncbi:MAG: OmpA family protein [Alphaproteobacteria bacterium]|nr:OmpA family protein [Alphaproteobacteria bacterium]